MNILFLDQSGKLGGAELSLLDVVSAHREGSCVALLEAGPFQAALQERQIPVQIISTKQSLAVSKQGGWRESIGSLGRLLPLVQRVAQLSRDYELLYANTPKALVVGALASVMGRRPLVYHLRDIISPDHFGSLNRWLLTTLANQRAARVIANSHATKAAFAEAGGNAHKVEVVYNGFEPINYQVSAETSQQLRQELGLSNQFVVGHFSRLAPWKGQHILLEALAQCPESVTVLLVGDALFGEQDYVNSLHKQVQSLHLESRVQFLGFRRDIPQLMAACDLITHTSTAPEPFGRVIVEAMLCDRPIIAAAAGGAVELVEHDKTGWLCPPNDSQRLAALIQDAFQHPEQCKLIAATAKAQAQQHYSLERTNAQISALLGTVIAAD
jgi:glycosyltransferase involved in cell wall biosynthesis